MEVLQPKNLETIARYLNEGKVGVMPTDTIYGLHCTISSEEGYYKIFDLKQREENKPLIILISRVEQLESIFDVRMTKYIFNVLKQYWPGPNSIIFTNRSEQTICCRIPKDIFLQNLMKLTGPLFSTSANITGLEPATELKHAQEYFGDNVDFYVDGGKLLNRASSIFKLNGDKLTQVR